MSAPPDIVVRRWDRWHLTAVPGSSPTEIPTDELVARLGVDVPPTVGPALADERILLPSPTFAARLEAGRLVVEVRGRDEVLDADDVRLIAAVEGPLPVGHLGHLPAAATRAARLVDLGLLQAEPAPPAPSPAPATAPTPPAARSSIVGRVLGRLRRVDAPEPAPAADEVPPGDGPRPSPAPAVPAPPTPAVALADPPGPSDPARIPVYAIWHEEVGPLLALGMLTAQARHADGGALTEHFDVRRPERVESFLADLARRSGPAVLLCSDYVWSLEQNLEAARAGVDANPDLIVLHGGPSSPKFEPDARVFLAEHGRVAHVLVRGEGEDVLVQLLRSIADSGGRLDFDRLRGIGGLTFVDARDGEVVRTPDQDRIADLDRLPSPYLTGEFDHIEPDAWRFCLSVETNRGCPYGCTFCDWGSSTMSRIRKFDLERVTAELEWAAARGIESINLPDANFGIMSRDVEIARRLADIRRTTGFPLLVSYYPAKNTTKHLARIMDELLAVGIGSTASLSLQTADEATLAAIDRSNISTDHYVALAAEFRRRGLPLQGDLLLGLPGQSFESYRRDLQFHIDHEVMARTWQVRILPNAPMNEPGYRAAHAIESDEFHRVMSTTTFSRDDRVRMLRLRTADIVAERFGVLRHVLRYLQWDHGIEATEVVVAVMEMADLRPVDYPDLAWVFSYFDLFQVPPGGWAGVYRDLGRFVEVELGVVRSSGLDTVLALQEHLMPSPGRRFPASVDLAHDYVAWYRSATDELYRSGHARPPEGRLEDRPPATFTIDDDPLDLCGAGLDIWGDPRDEMFENDFLIGANSAYELRSPLMRLFPHVAQQGIPLQRPLPTDAAPVELTDDDPVGLRAGGDAASVAVPVDIERRR